MQVLLCTNTFVRLLYVMQDILSVMWNDEDINIEELVICVLK